MSADRSKKVDANSIMSVAIVALIAATGMMHITLTPLIVGGFVDDLGFTSKFAGWITTAAVGGTALGAVLTSVFLSRLDIRSSIYCCLALMLVFDLLTTLTTDGSMLMALRFGAGFSGSVASSIALGTFAALQQPGRGYGAFNIFYFGLAAVTFLSIPYAMESLSMGVSAIFYTIMAFTCLCLVLFTFINLASHSQQGRSLQTGSLDLLFNPAVLISLLMFMLIMVATGGLWTYFERLGVSAGLTLEHIGLSISSSSITGGIGAFAAILLGSWCLKYPAFAIGTLCYAVGIYILTNPNITANEYYCAALMEGLGLSFLISIYQTLLASLDKAGRIAALGVFVIAIGRTLGVILATSLVTDNSFTVVPWTSLALLLVSFIGITAVLLIKREPVQLEG